MCSRYLALFVFGILFYAGCSPEQEASLFKKLSSQQTGVTFENTITTSDTLNIHNYPFMYNGGGVAIGDINNDGLSDLFFTGNMVTSRLYLNKGGMQFEDITESAGVETNRWASGVSMVDLNADGYLDIYVSVVAPENSRPEERANLLFINNGDNTFTEAAGAYNIADTGFTTHAAFLDYDRDGDLDLYLLNHSPGSFARNEAVRQPSILFGQTSTSYDQLYRNNGDGSFTNVTLDAGILREEGFGLGIAVSDINHDGWPDIYVSNDILPDDVLYINNQDGTFSDKTDEWLKHTSFAGMGVDVADFNNDGWPDILQVDMMPENYRERKVMSGGISYEHYNEMRQKGFHYQYSINTLQLSNGINSDGEVIFSEIARLAGVAYTDWSWSALFGDYDNDGYKDIMIANGFPKAINNYDYLVNMNKGIRFGTRESREKRQQQILKNLHSYKIPNYIFRNEGDLTFSDKTGEWKFDDPGFSFGASQADLDNDGDLDIVINNVNAEAFIYQNEASRLKKYHYLSLKLKGSTKNTQGLGAKVVVKSGDKKQYQYQSPYRGYQSSVDDKLFFGLGNYNRVDSLKIIWPDGRVQLLTNLMADQLVTLDYEDAKKADDRVLFWWDQFEDKPFSEITVSSGLEYKHKENAFVDYNTQKLLPYQLSKLGPPLTSGDVNGDGLDDLYIGGASGQPGFLYLQEENGKFRKADRLEPWSSDKDFEDIGAAFLDADGDDDLDLYVASGGYEFSPASDFLQDRLYLNNGSGAFVRIRSALPRMFTSSSCMKAADYDNDGDPDLFVGGRQVPGRYPFPAKSYLLRNDGGAFSDVTSEVAPELEKPGLITDAEWIDFDGDGDQDLVTTGEWLPVQFYRNQNGSLEEVTELVGLSSQTGWWYSLETGDFDNDGDPDFVAGNLGLNYSYTTSGDKKFEVFAADFDKNRTVDIFYAMNENGTYYPVYGKAKVGAAIPAINKKFHSYNSFAEATLEEVVGEDPLEAALHYQVDTFASVYIENKGGDSFVATPLPNEAQFSAVMDILSADVDSDGNLDLILAGNIYSSEPESARNDAGTGLWLKGNGKGHFTPITSYKSGFFVPRDVKDLELITIASHKYVLVANNDDSLQVFKIR